MKKRADHDLEQDQRSPDWDVVFDRISGDPRVAAYTASVNTFADNPAHRDPFHVLIATLISLRTRDEVTLPAARRVLSETATPEAVATLSEERLASLIYPAGFYRTKARTIRKICRILVAEHDGRVPSSARELNALPGVGPKTANLVLALGFGIPAICVDTHVHRVANRIGWISTDTPEKSISALEAILPVRYWIPINQWLVAFGRIICTPGRPRCSECPVYSTCRRVGVHRTR